MEAALAARWWDALPEDFYLRTEGTELDARHPLKVHGTAALDRALRTGLGSLMVSALLPTVLSPARVRREQELLSYYRELIDEGRQERIFVPPRPGTPVREGRDCTFTSHGHKVPARLLSFASEFVPLHPRLQEPYLLHRRNRRAWAQYWTHPDGPRPTLMFVHGFTADSYRFNRHMFSLPWLHRAGYDILLCVLPFHGARRGRVEPFSGYGYFARGLASLNEAMLNGVHDLRVWLDYLFERGAPNVGISGLSLGGYLSALLASVDDRLAYCIPNSPVVTPIDMAREWLPMRWLLHTVMRRGGVGVQQLRHALALHSPLSWMPKIEPQRLLIIGGAGDRLTPPRFVRLLHQHWQGSELHWFPGNHIVHLQQGAYLKRMRRFMDRYSAQ
jgi:pimeloyl-ACP methyl ester carboxylesterase